MASNRTGLYLILPVLILVGFFTIYPFAYAIWLSFVKYVIYEPQDIGKWAGLENYFSVIGSSYFSEALINTFIFTAISTAVIVSCALGVSLVLSQNFKGSTFVRVAMLVPWAIPPAAAGLIWRFMFQSFGWINKVMVDLGLWAEPIYFLGAPRPYQIMLATVAQLWQQLPFSALLLFAVLQLIPEDIKDSAKIDGATGLRGFRYITLSYMKTGLALVAAFQALLALTTYEMVYTFAGGTFGLISYYAFANMFQWGNFGNGGALSVILALMTLAVILLIVFKIFPPEKMYRYTFTGE
jgi:multiple sugar transport system permease protein